MWWPSGERLFDPHRPEQFPRIVAPYQKYITTGNALASRHRWKLAGRWTARPGEPGGGKREIFVHSVGNKGELIPRRGLLAGLCVRTGPPGAALQRADPNASCPKQRLSA